MNPGTERPLLPHLEFFLSQQDQHIDPVAWINFSYLVGFNTQGPTEISGFVPLALRINVKAEK